MSILLPKLSKRIKDEETQLIKQQIINWILGLAANNLKIKMFDGSEYSPGQVRYEGSPSQLFGSDKYIKPLLKDFTIKRLKN